VDAPARAVRGAAAPHRAEHLARRDPLAHAHPRPHRLVRGAQGRPAGAVQLHRHHAPARHRPREGHHPRRRRPDRPPGHRRQIHPAVPRRPRRGRRLPPPQHHRARPPTAGLHGPGPGRGGGAGAGEREGAAGAVTGRRAPGRPLTPHPTHLHHHRRTRPRTLGGRSRPGCPARAAARRQGGGEPQAVPRRPGESCRAGPAAGRGGSGRGSGNVHGVELGVWRGRGWAVWGFSVDKGGDGEKSATETGDGGDQR
jgi:hypothetical protein